MARPIKVEKCRMLENKPSFAKGVENLVNPIDVGTIHFVQQLNQLLPRIIRKSIMKASSKKTPSMGFVVEPYSSFLCYEIKDLDKAKKLLPKNFQLIKTKIFEDDKPKYYCIISSFRAHTSAFWGNRTEFYVIAEDKRTNLLSWVIIDYDTNTISHDPKNGLRPPNSNSIITINHRGDLFVDVKNKKINRICSYNFNVEKGQIKNLDQRLWLEGNLSIGYGKKLSDEQDSVFSLKFEPCEVEKALYINPKDVNNLKNTWYENIVVDKPNVVVCFPYAQHFISDSPGYSSNLRNENELVQSISSMNFDKISVFSTKSLKVSMLVGLIISLSITFTLLALYLTK